MTKITNRDRLLRLVQGEDLSSTEMFEIEYSLDIRGKVTIWGGTSFLKSECVPMLDDPKVRVRRILRPLYEYHRLSPYTARIYQIEQEIDSTITDDQIVEEFKRFRSERPTEGFSQRTLFDHIGEAGQIVDEEGRPLSLNRRDKQEVHDRLLKQERQDILNLWGIDCPPDINNSENYGRRLSQNKGQVSGWFETEFTRIGGDISKHWGKTSSFSI